MKIHSHIFNPSVTSDSQPVVLVCLLLTLGVTGLASGHISFGVGKQNV